MQVKNILENEVLKSNLGNYLKSYQLNENRNIYLKGDFYIDGNIFLPIEKNSYSTSLELFSISNPQKYINYFTPDYLNTLKNSTKEIKVLRKCFVIGNDENYCHNLIYYIPRIMTLLKNKEILSSVDYILFNKSLPKYFYDLVNEILKIHEIKKELILIDKKLYLLKESYCPSFTGRIYNLEENVKFWNKYYINIIEKNSTNDETNDKIYISREDSNNRKIINEDELVSNLKKIGFKSITLSKLDIFKQMQLFRNAKVIVGYHGAGFVNILFSKRNTKVIELFPNSKNIVRKTFEVISQIKKFDHVYYYIDYILKKKNSSDLKDFDGVVDINKFISFLTSYLDDHYVKYNK